MLRELIKQEENKIKAVRMEADDLRNEVQKLREETRVKLVDFIRLGALVRGKCDVCKEV